MAHIYIISQEWSEQPWYNTGGTRAKKYLLGPNGKYYFFKRSQYKEPTAAKPGKDFKYEFWNEIISYELGTSLGFDMLRYDISIDGEIIGCISESMVNEDNQELNEGVKYLKAFLPDFDPAKKEYRAKYSFGLIESSLIKSNLSSCINNIIEIIVFDALIGNGDRHQENWAVITIQRLITEAYEQVMKSQSPVLSFLKRNIASLKSREIPIPKSFYIPNNKFAPIYDSGSSLGRELTEDAVELFLVSEPELRRYISKGQSEIHWENKKITHFELIRNLLNSPHKESVQRIIARVVERFDGTRIESVIKNIDQGIPETHVGYRIPEPRKQLIFKIITLRFEMLKALIDG